VESEGLGAALVGRRRIDLIILNINRCEVVKMVVVDVSLAGVDGFWDLHSYLYA